MTDPDAPPSVSQDNVIAAALAPMQVIAETVVGYHKKLVDGGIALESASKMAEEYHTALLNMMQSQLAAQTIKGAFGRKR